MAVREAEEDGLARIQRTTSQNGLRNRVCAERMQPVVLRKFPVGILADLAQQRIIGWLARPGRNGLASLYFDQKSFRGFRIFRRYDQTMIA